MKASAAAPVKAAASRKSPSKGPAAQAPAPEAKTAAAKVAAAEAKAAAPSPARPRRAAKDAAVRTIAVATGAAAARAEDGAAAAAALVLPEPNSRARRRARRAAAKVSAVQEIDAALDQLLTEADGPPAGAPADEEVAAAVAAAEAAHAEEGDADSRPDDDDGASDGGDQATAGGSDGEVSYTAAGDTESDDEGDSYAAPAPARHRLVYKRHLVDLPEAPGAPYDSELVCGPHLWAFSESAFDSALAETANASKSGKKSHSYKEQAVLFAVATMLKRRQFASAYELVARRALGIGSVTQGADWSSVDRAVAPMLERIGSSVQLPPSVRQALRRAQRTDLALAPRLVKATDKSSGAGGSAVRPASRK